MEFFQIISSGIFSLIGAGSLFFIVGGMLLLGLAFGLDRFRRSLLETMDDDKPTEPPDSVLPAQEGAPS